MKKLLSIVLWILLVGGTAFAAQKWVRDANPFHVFQAIKVTSNWSLSWDCFFQAQNWVVSDCQGNSFLTGVDLSWYITWYTETDPVWSIASWDYVPKTFTSDITVTWNMHSITFKNIINYSINTIWFYLNNLAWGNVLSRWASWLRNYVQSYYYSWIIVDTENLVLKRNVYSVFSDTHIPAIATGYSANDRRQGMSGNDIVFNQYDWANWDKRLGMWNSFYVGEDMQTLWDHSAAVGGKMNIASGNYSIVIGWFNNNAWWNYSIIWWQANKAPWTNSVVIWWATNVATWGYSFIGWWSNNKSFWTHSFVAWWDSNVASWVHSFAWWDTSVAYVSNSFAWWVGVEAKTVYWIAFWAHNIWYTDALLEIGNGNGITENNAMTLYWASQEYKVEFEWPIGIEWTWTHMAFRFARSWERIEAQYYTWGVWVSAVCSGWKFILP